MQSTGEEFNVQTILEVVVAYGRDSFLPFLDTFTDLLFIVSNDFASDILFYSAIVFYLMHPFGAAAVDVLCHFHLFVTWVPYIPWEQMDNLLLFAMAIILLIILVFLVFCSIVPCLAVLMLLHSTRLIAIIPLQRILFRNNSNDFGHGDLLDSKITVKEMNLGYFLESLPQLIINLVNSSQLGKLNNIALVSLSISALMLLNGIYKLVHGHIFDRNVVQSKLNELCVHRSKNYKKIKTEFIGS
jgi:hypothetical protein